MVPENEFCLRPKAGDHLYIFRLFPALQNVEKKTGLLFSAFHVIFVPTSGRVPIRRSSVL